MNASINFKITRPHISSVVNRERVFSILEDRLRKPIVWISSPAGSGKTTLVASYLESRKLPCLWYQCDEGDSDLAAFFYYMGLAVKKALPRHKHNLPFLTHEYVFDIPTFTKRYFEKLCHKLTHRYPRHDTPSITYIVLDNYQDIPASSPFHGMIAHGLDIIPKGVNIFIISRSNPPTPFARLEASGRINLLGYNELRFTFEETEKLVKRHTPQMDNTSVKNIFDNTEGWVAGIVLMLESLWKNKKAVETVTDASCERIFDYFIEEIFNRTKIEVQEFLMKTAFLTVISNALARKLTGYRNAEKILSFLNYNNYFTERFPAAETYYRYHPLFRDFLINKAKDTYEEEALTEIQRNAALYLEQSGHTEEAAGLYCGIGDIHGISRMVNTYARKLLKEGRNKTVEDWIRSIPDGLENEDPWLLYWAGMCAFPLDMPRMRRYMEKALNAFRSIDDISGIYLSWARIIDTVAFELNEWRRLDDSIKLFNELMARYPVFPSEEIELIASSRMLMALILRKTDQPERILSWFNRISALLQKIPSKEIQMDVLFFIIIYNVWKGDYNKNAVLLERAEADIMGDRCPPLSAICIRMMQGVHYWITAQYDSALRALNDGLEISGTSGVYIFDSLLWSFKAAAEMAIGFLEEAKTSVKNQRACALASGKSVDMLFCSVNLAWLAILKGDFSLAKENLELIKDAVSRAGNPYFLALWHIGMAQVAFLQERKGDAQKHIMTANRLGRAMKSHVVEWYSLLVNAYFLLQDEKDKKGLPLLSRALSLGKQYGYVHLEFYQPSVMQFLCMRALAEGMYPEYVRELIKKLKLIPPLHPSSSISALSLEYWPYPIKIYTLGRFEIVKEGKPVEFTRKIQKKPLEMLKAIVAYGGNNVPIEYITESLWPDSEGDLAKKSFDMTLSRLRRLLGGDRFVKNIAGQVTLEPLYCWVDSIILKHILEEIRNCSTAQDIQLCEKAIGLYKGEFLPSDTYLPFILSKQEKLKNDVLRAIRINCRYYEQTGQWEKAAELYKLGLDIDYLAEQSYQSLMKCYKKLGRKAEAVSIYNSLCRVLWDKLGIVPSKETQAIYSSIVKVN